jgi:hypothetical protein
MIASNPISVNGIEAELQPGERVLWAGRPRPLRIMLQNGEALVTGLLAVAALFVLLFAFPVTSVFSFVFFGCGFPWVFLFVLALPFYYFARPVADYLSAERTVYVVTDRRALIIRPRLGGKTVQSYNRIGQIERRERSGGSGDLIFASETEAGGRAARRVRTRKIGFIGIANVREVERLLLESLGSTGAPMRI